jgi:hypothetical protein
VAFPSPQFGHGKRQKCPQPIDFRKNDRENRVRIAETKMTAEELSQLERDAILSGANLQKIILPDGRSLADALAGRTIGVNVSHAKRTKNGGSRRKIRSPLSAGDVGGRANSGAADGGENQDLA